VTDWTRLTSAFSFKMLMMKDVQKYCKHLLLGSDEPSFVLSSFTKKVV